MILENKQTDEETLASADSNSNEINVLCRIKPCDEKDEERCIKIIDSKSLAVVSPHTKALSSGLRQELICSLKKIFGDNTSQKDLFDSAANDMVTDLIKGLIFTYGITGSGKTYTLNGTSAEPGILPRCITNVYNSVKNNLNASGTVRLDKYGQIELVKERGFNFNASTNKRNHTTLCETPACLRTANTEVQNESSLSCALFISMVEIYHNNIFDLLDEQLDNTNSMKTPLSKGLRENSAGNIFIYGLTYQPISSISEALTYFRKGKKRRKVAETLLNSQSSRSHCVFTIYLIQMERLLDGHLSGTVSQLSLCDLAGSERLYRTQNEGDRQKESSSINSSLMTLRTCIETLRENQKHSKKHAQPRLVPYRESRLTFMFRNYFEGDGKIRMILCINPASGDFEENLHVVRFAEITQEIKIKQEPIKKQDFKEPTPIPECLEIVRHENSTLFPAFPSCILNNYNDSKSLPEILSYLSKCDRIRSSAQKELAKLFEILLRDIAAIEQENLEFKCKESKFKEKVEELERESTQLRHSHKINKSKINSLEDGNKKVQSELAMVRSELEVMKQKFNSERSGRHILKRKLKEVQSQEEDKIERECSKRVHEATEEMKNKLYQHDQKMKIVKDVLQNTSRLPPLSDTSRGNTVHTPKTKTSANGRRRKSSSFKRI